MKRGKILAIVAIYSLLSTGAAFAGGAYNDSIRTDSDVGPSSASPTPGFVAGPPAAAAISGRSVGTRDRAAMKRRMRHPL